MLLLFSCSTFDYIKRIRDRVSRLKANTCIKLEKRLIIAHDSINRMASNQPIPYMKFCLRVVFHYSIHS